MGQIITFYSYKGGVGRTMALANVAVLLTQWGYKVLIVDWDLEAPGLENFFKKYLDLETVAQHKGVTDLLDYISGKPVNWQDLLVRIMLPDSPEALHFLTAGQRDEDYFSRVRNLNLKAFYKQEGGFLIEQLRNEWKGAYDYVLVDSRTGITDIGGVCTIQLPDILVLLFTANDQSLNGVIDVARKANRARQKLPFDRLTLTSLPIPSRFDSREEFGISQEWLNRFASELAEIYANWLPTSVERRQFLEITKIPYISYFSFGEKLAVLEQGTIDPSGLGYAYETLAALIAKNLESVEQLMESRDEFVRSASKTREPLKTKIALRTKVWNVPFPRNPFLTGREEVIKQLRNALLSDRVVVLSGFGGIGKTQTAVEYAYRHRDEYQAVLWANADSHDERVSAFVAIANLLNLPENSTPDVVVGVKRWLDNNTGWLLIVDNADTPQSVKDSLPRNPRGHLLLTSRVWGFNNLGIAKPIVLEAMQPDEAKAFLLKRTGRHDAPLQFEEGVAVEQLAWELDYFPLALEIAGAYITKIKSTFRDYLLSYHKRGLSLLEKSGSASNYPNSVTTIWTQNFEQVKQISEAAADLLRVSAFLNPEDIPLELITLGAVELGPALSVALANVDEDPLALDEVLEPLTQYSLIRRDYESRTYDIPHLVQAVLKAGMDEATQREWAERTVRAVRRAFTPDTIPDESLRDHYDRFLPHIQSCAGLIKKVNVILVLDVAQMLSQTGDYFREIARFDVAKSLLHQAAAIYEKRVLPNDPRLAGVRSSLGELYWELGRYAEAEPFYQDALENQQFLDPDHPDMATDLENYASLLREMGRNAEAEGMEIRAKDIRAKHAQANP